MRPNDDPLRVALERVLGRQYDIVRLLGRGGMGAVYLARERALERTVAIKILPPECAADADSRERFRREARTAAKLTHPNIVPLYTFGDVDGMLYFVMGYVQGESLAERLRREGKLPPEDARRVLAEVADALHYAHRQGVVHRDIKPDNILLDAETGRPMLTDFGVAKAQASGATLTEAGAVVGTPYYMSPEQASGVRELDGRSDLYSLGVMGYQMLAGRLPFEGETFQDVIVQHVAKEPVPLATVVPDAPSDLVEAVMRCLAKEPAKRWGDGQQLRAAMDLADDEYEMPEIEARLDGVGFMAAAGVWAGAMFGLAFSVLPGLRGPDSGGAWGLAAFFSLAGPVMVTMNAIAARRRGVRWSTIRRRILHPPRWWPFWWPRRWRRAGDVWDRLPGLLRWSRILSGGSFIYLFVVSLPLFIWGLGGAWDEALKNLATVTMFVMFGPVYLLIGAAVAPTFGLRRQGLADEYNRLAFAPTSRLAFWRQPRFAAVLLPAGRGSAAAPTEPRTPAELARSIADLIGQMPGDARASFSGAGDAARQAVELVAAMDAELASLARDADPKELESVEAGLRALGPGAADEPDLRHQKRALLVSQRDLLWQLGEQLRILSDHRARLVEMLRTMWLQLAALRADAARENLAVTEISGRVQALCADLDAHVQAAEAVRAELG